ncbi:unnamed protein product [Calypogeia fissa]
MAARVNSEVRCSCSLLFAHLAVAVLLLSGVAAARSVSGWDVSLSTGSSDSTLWRRFTTPGQAAGYHRLLLSLETSRKASEEVGEVGAFKFSNKAAAGDFSAMDYADPRSNRPGSSDQTTPPAP